MKLQSVIVCLIFCVMTFGCTSVFHKDIGLRKDVFQDKPIWESQQFQELKNDPNFAAGGYSLNDLPGLSLLINQVLGEESPSPISFSAAHPSYSGPGTLMVTNDETPLPPEVAQEPVTKALIWSMASSFSAFHMSNANYEPWKLKNSSLSTKDFLSFVQSLSKSIVVPFHSSTPVQDNHKILAFANKKEVTWAGLFNAYLINYYSGKFIDRTGGIYSKPKIGLNITNETITAFISVFLEATFDYAILAGNNLKVPIIFDGTVGTPKFLTNGNKEPTLVKVVKALEGSIELEHVVEKVQVNHHQPGITKEKLCVIREISGISGDAAQGLNGTLIRLAGGGTGGIAFLNGKISIGDNETLVKVIDTLLENVAKRTSEAAVSHLLYDLTYNNNTQLLSSGGIPETNSKKVQAWNILKSRLDVSKLIGCFF